MRFLSFGVTTVAPEEKQKINWQLDVIRWKDAGGAWSVLSDAMPHSCLCQGYQRFGSAGLSIRLWLQEFISRGFNLESFGCLRRLLRWKRKCAIDHDKKITTGANKTNGILYTIEQLLMSLFTKELSFAKCFKSVYPNMKLPNK